MSIVLLIVIIGVIGFVLIGIVMSSSGQNNSLPEDISEDDIRDMMRQGRKIEAIKYCRALYGIGLKDAKDMVEKMMSNEPGEASNRPSSDITDMDIIQLAESGNKIEAIKQYRSIYNTGLAEAKKAVEKMVKEQYRM